MDTTYRKNLKAVLTASKNYTDNSIEKLKWEFGTYDLSVETINGTTMLLPTPANTIQATMDKIYGASKVSENLAILTDTAQTTDRGVTYSISNGAINVNDSATANLTITLSSLTYFNGTYTFKNFGSQALSNSVYFVFLLDGQWTTVVTVKSDSGTITLNGNYVYGIAITSGTSVSGTIKPMLVSGSTAPSEFKVGYDGIHNLELSGLKVEGANLANTALFELGAINVNTGEDLANNERMRSNYIEIKPNTYYSLKWDNANINVVCYDENKVKTGSSAVAGTFLTTPTTKYVRFYSGLITTSTQIMLNEGNTALPYEPYVSQTLPIDLSTILYNGSPLFEGNSLKGYGSYSDYLTPYKAFKIEKQIKLKDLPIVYDSNNAKFITNDISLGNIANTTSILSNVYATGNPTYSSGGMNDMTIATHNSSSGIFYIKDTRFTSVADLKASWTDNDYLIYPLATPIETDIDLSQLVKFDAHSNGTITLVNTNNQDTASTIKYLKEVAK